MKSTKVVVKKYNGDDDHSWAVFRADRVKDLGKIVFCEDAPPIFAGCTKKEALYYKKCIDAGEIVIT